MAFETHKGPESIESATSALVHELGLLNINAQYVDDKVLPALVTFEGVLDITISEQGSDADIEELISKMNRIYQMFTFSYDGLGAIMVMPKVQ